MIKQKLEMIDVMTIAAGDQVGAAIGQFLSSLYSLSSLLLHVSLVEPIDKIGVDVVEVSQGVFYCSSSYGF